MGCPVTSRLPAAALALLLTGFMAVSADEPEGVVVQVADAYIVQEESGRAWVLGNDGIVFRVGLSASGALVPLGLRRPDSDEPWRIESAPDLTFQQQSRRLSPGQSGFPFRAAHAEEFQGGVRLRLIFDDVTSRLRVTRSYVCYPQAPAIETWSTFEAIDTATAIPISDIGVLQLTVPLTDARWVTGLRATAIDGGRFTRREQGLTAAARFEVGSTTRSSESVVPTLWFGGPHGRLFTGLLWSGPWSLTATGPTAAGMTTVRLSTGATATTVRRGDPVDSPRGVFGVAGHDDAGVTAGLQQYVMNGIRQGRPITPLVTYNSWFAYGVKIDDECMRAEMVSAAALGVELFVLDAGWYPGGAASADFTTGLGTWAVDTRRFPGGLGPLGDHARSLGMKFGLWVEPEHVDTSNVDRTGLARERFLATTGGRYNPGVKNENADSAQICLADAEARNWVLAQLVEFIDEARPDYLKWDNNYWINCDRTNHGHGTQDGSFGHVEGLYSLLAALRARFPDLLIENCSGGGHRLDLGMLRYTDAGWMDDDTGPSAHVRHNLQGLGAVFPAHYLLSFVIDDPAELIHEAADMALYFRSRMPGVLGLTLIGAEFGEHDTAQMVREVDLYKLVRSAAPNPVMTLLTPQAREATAAEVWDAVQLSSRETGGRVVLAFGGREGEQRTTIWPVALEPDTRYRVMTSRGREVGVFTGATLMHDGLELGGPYTAGHVVILTPVGS